MLRIFACIFIIMLLFLRIPELRAWTDDVQGMLMPSPRGEDTMSDEQAVTENIEGTQDTGSDEAGDLVEWAEK